MNKKTIIYYIFSCILLGLYSCSDWTDTESAKINIQDSGTGDKTEYYKDLRAYKETDHKITYLYFDNKIKNASSNGQLMTSIPDSVDIVCLSDAKLLTDQEVSTMKQLKEERSYQFVYNVDIESIKTYYNQLALEVQTNNTKIKDQTTYISDTLSTVLSYSSNLDGLVLNYVGKDVRFLSDDDKTTYVSVEDEIIKLLQAWLTNNPNKFLTLKGNPQYWVNKVLLNTAKHLILNTSDNFNKDKVLMTISDAVVSGVPLNKFILAVNAVSFKEGESSVGYWTLSDGSSVSAIAQMALIAASSNTPYPIQGISIINGSNDYYQTTARYKNVRTGINLMNPSLKN